MAKSLECDVGCGVNVLLRVQRDNTGTIIIRFVLVFIGSYICFIINTNMNSTDWEQDAAHQG